MDRKLQIIRSMKGVSFKLPRKYDGDVPDSYRMAKIRSNVRTQ